MEYKYQFKTDEDLEALKSKNSDKFITKIWYLVNGNFVVFSDTPTIEIMQQEQGNKISILEAENADLLLDSAIKDSKISTLENDLADLTLEIAMMEVR